MLFIWQWQLRLNNEANLLASGSSFQVSESTAFSLGATQPTPTPTGYYVTTQGLTGYTISKRNRSWQNNTTASNAVLNGSSNQVFENWVVAMLLKWHNNDPVSQMELDRNQAAFEFQGNRNPYIDHPEFVEMIW